MLDILAEIIQALTGGKKKPPPQPRRRVRPPAETQPQGTFAKSEPRDVQSQADPGSFEAMMQDLFGVPMNQEREEAPPPPPPQQQPRALPPRRQDRPARHPEAAIAPAKKQSAVEQAYLKAIAAEKALEAAEEQALAPAPATDLLTAAPSRTAAKPPDFVARLRKNSNAAREAFVYAEIFGPPLADREGGVR